MSKSIRPGLSAAQMRGLGRTVDLATAAGQLGISRPTAYVLAQKGELPVSCFKVGQQWRIPTEALIRLLQLDDEASPERDVSERTAA